MTWFCCLFYSLTLFASLAAIIGGENGNKAEAVIWTVCAGVCLFIALMLNT